MSIALGISGWLLGVTGIAAAGLLRIRLARRADAVARACHEVRGPLTAVRLGLELASRFRQLSHPRLRAIELELGRAAAALDDLSAVTCRRSAARAEPVDIAELVATSVDAWRAVAAAQKAMISLDCAGQPVRVAGDRLRLAQAIGNLLANAIEHGGGAVQVRLRPGVGRVRVEVVDAGPGLPAPIDQLARQRGRRGRPAHGHGLRIASRIVADHGGRLAAAPSHLGARIVLELPALPGIPVLRELPAGQARDGTEPL